MPTKPTNEAIDAPRPTPCLGTPRRTRRVNRGRRGYTLPLVLVLLFVFAITAAMVMSLVNATLRSAHVRSDQTEALNIADGGADLGLAWLTQQSAPPTDAVLRNMSGFWGTNGTISAPFGYAGSTLTVTIYSDSGNAGTTQKRFVIEAVAQMPSGVRQIVRTYVRQVSFGKYAFFTVNDGGGFWDYNNHFEGPFHSDDADGAASTFLWTQNPSGGPMCTYGGSDAFSVSGNPTWWLNTIGNNKAPSTASDFNSIAVGGVSTMTMGYLTDVHGNLILDSNGKKIPNSPSIPLPSTDYAQEYVAVGQVPPTPCNAPPSSVPSTSGVTLTSGGGIYIKGDSQIVLSVDGSGNQVIKVTSNPTGSTVVQTITLYAGSGAAMTTVTTPLVGTTKISYASVSTPLNGVVFADGNITSMSGTVANNRVDAKGNITAHNSLTIATNTAAGDDIILTNSLKYSTSRNLAIPQASDTNFNTNAGVLGLEARNIVLSTLAPAQVEFDAIMLCTGTFQAATPKSPVGNAGVMLSIGGVIVNNAGVFAYGDSNGLVISGYNEQYHYDQRLADYPPPWFPTTGNHYDVISWQNPSSTLASALAAQTTTTTTTTSKSKDD